MDKMDNMDTMDPMDARKIVRVLFILVACGAAVYVLWPRAATPPDDTTPSTPRATADDDAGALNAIDDDTDAAPGREIRIVGENASLHRDGDVYILRITLTGTLLATLLDATALEPRPSGSRYDAPGDELAFSRALASASESILRHRMDPRSDMLRGDEVTFAFRLNARGVPSIYALRYRGRAGRFVRAYYFWEPHRSSPEYFDENGVAFAPRLDHPPIRESTGYGRVFGERGREEMEILAPVGAEVVAPFRATVARLNWRPKDEGRSLMLAYEGSGVVAAMTGLSDISSRVRVGEAFEAGAVVGRAGLLGGGLSGVRYRLLTRPDESAPRVDPFDFHGRRDYALTGSAVGFFERVRRRAD
ncbi:hypothetical protein K8I61_14915, partial [bacterium]|nr:hypothetical protein [bacterium]